MKIKMEKKTNKWGCAKKTHTPPDRRAWDCERNKYLGRASSSHVLVVTLHHIRVAVDGVFGASLIYSKAKRKNVYSKPKIASCEYMLPYTPVISSLRVCFVPFSISSQHDFCCCCKSSVFGSSFRQLSNTISRKSFIMEPGERKNPCKTNATDRRTDGN